jgi:signal transduction histidine kinase
MHVDTDAEILRLQTALRDLVALSAIPAAWSGREPPAVAAGLADTLVALLQLDFAFVRMSYPDRGYPDHAGAVDVARGSAWEGFPEWLEHHVAAKAQFPSQAIVADVGNDSEPCRAVAVPIGVNGDGGLVAAASARSDFPTAVEQVLLSLAANQAATSFENACLIEERRRAEEELRAARDDLEVKVAERTAELAASRRRIVAASDEARRRIERDLHDGMQQRLVSLGLAVRAAEAEVPSDRRDLRGELSSIATGLRDAVAELRELSRGIHPAILSQGGLGPALRTLARRSVIPVALDVAREMRLTEPIEVAIYYVVSEALANVAKHAQASRVEISLAPRSGSTLLSIRDDGIGGADPARGSGLVGVADRVEALGGSVRVSSRPGDGTQITAELPLELEMGSNAAGHPPRLAEVGGSPA